MSSERAAALLEDWRKPMKPSPLNADKLEYPVAVEKKLDGVRVLLIIRHDSKGEYEVQTLSYNGKEFTSLQPIVDAVLDAFAETSIDYDVIFDGEVYAGSFKETISAVRKKTDQVPEGVVYNIFDMVALETLEDLNCKHSTRMYKRRRRDLAEFFLHGKPDPARIRMTESVLCSSEEGLWALYKEVREHGVEGLVVKNLDGYWWCRRNRDWMKIKDKKSVDIPVVDAFVGEGKCEGILGNLVCDYNGVRVSVGSGFTDAQREKMWTQYLRDCERLKETEGDLDDPRLELLGKVAEVSYHEETPDKSLRHPVFESIRIDKDRTDSP